MELIRNEKVAENTVEIEFKVSAEELEAAIAKVFKKAAKDIQVPGFRKGKAPRKMIEKVYGEDIFFNDAIDEVLPMAYEDAAKESGAVIVAQPSIDLVEISKENGATFKATLTVYPEVTIGEYKGLKAEKKSIPVTEELIAADLNALLNRNSRLVSVSDRAAALEDIANIDFEGFIDGVAFDGGKGEGYDLTLGSGAFIPGFEDQIVGHEIGEEFDVEVTFPEEYGASDLAGKAAVFKTKLNSIQVKELPELDDEFAKDVSEFDTLEELKDDLKLKREEEANRSAELALENDLVDQVVNGMSAIIPEAMVDTRVEDLVNDFANRLANQGLDLDTYLMYTNSDMDSFKKEYRDQAEKQVKIRLALEAVAKAEAIEASEEEVEEELKKLAEAYGMELADVKRQVPVDILKGDLAIQKAIDLIKANAEVTNA